ncbi:short-chain dehydrogenase [Amycolatopsis deserti]|uniref:Short-chain dehydrogenase n=1 Tax=Amycolatopsis deserti TaxID=185696 RepID=A0ABQ3IIE1_9PSEU|nr:SDR family oxidoreductase [Amycolatopsis deserti]GHE79265.1 short-chain dehydrogenase [Amycolatopsis deserti]
MKRVLVAGASGGIGAACVRALRTAGCVVSGVDRPEADLGEPGVAERVVADAVSRHGGLDGVVHAIGMSGRRLGDGPLEHCADEAWETLLQVNLTSAMWLLRAAIPALRECGGGSIAIVGSALARARVDADFHTVAYAVSKSALEALARVAAQECAPYGIRVNVAAAGLVDTPMARRALTDDRIGGRLGALMPLTGRAAHPGEVADVVSWLLSDSSRLVTGAVIPADGGWAR